LKAAKWVIKGIIKDSESCLERPCTTSIAVLMSKAASMGLTLPSASPLRAFTACVSYRTLCTLEKFFEITVA